MVDRPDQHEPEEIHSTVQAGDGQFTPAQLRAAWEEYMLDGARYGDIEDVREALGNQADVNAPDTTGRTALHMAAANGHAAVVELLLANGANTEHANTAGNTALHWACVGGSVEVAKMLLKHGANASALNNADRTPLDDALDNAGILALFKQHGQALEEGGAPVAADVPPALPSKVDEGTSSDRKSHGDLCASANSNMPITDLSAISSSSAGEPGLGEQLSAMNL
jgi:Ankyrin repeats (3 copies)